MMAKILVYALPVLILAIIHPAEAQQPKVYRVGVIFPGGAWYETIDGLRVGLRQLGLEVGKQLNLIIRETKGDAKATEKAAKNLEEEKVNLIYTAATSVTIAESGGLQIYPSFSLLEPIRLHSGWWIASQNRGEDLQAYFTGTATSLENA